MESLIENYIPPFSSKAKPNLELSDRRLSGIVPGIVFVTFRLFSPSFDEGER